MASKDLAIRVKHRRYILSHVLRAVLLGPEVFDDTRELEEELGPDVVKPLAGSVGPGEPLAGRAGQHYHKGDGSSSQRSMDDGLKEFDDVSKMDHVRVNLLTGPDGLRVDLDRHVANGPKAKEVQGAAAALNAPEEGNESKAFLLKGW